jgi:DNA repair exonuclease SbcCD ATPase subunit
MSTEIQKLLETLQALEQSKLDQVAAAKSLQEQAESAESQISQIHGQLERLRRAERLAENIKQREGFLELADEINSLTRQLARAVNNFYELGHQLNFHFEQSVDNPATESRPCEFPMDYERYTPTEIERSTFLCKLPWIRVEGKAEEPLFRLRLIEQLEQSLNTELLHPK